MTKKLNNFKRIEGKQE